MPQSRITQRRSKIIAQRWARIRLFAMDVDGVLTDGTVQIHSDGTEAKSFSILDGHGLRQLERNGIITAWISGRASGATTVRATELQIPHVVQGRIDKLSALQELAAWLALAPEQCAYMGDDDIDAPALAWAGIGIAPPAAMPSALAAAAYVTRRAAGHGAVREVCELLLQAERPWREELIRRVASFRTALKAAPTSAPSRSQVVASSGRSKSQVMNPAPATRSKSP